MSRRLAALASGHDLIRSAWRARPPPDLLRRRWAGTTRHAPLANGRNLCPLRSQRPRAIHASLYIMISYRRPSSAHNGHYVEFARGRAVAYFFILLRGARALAHFPRCARALRSCFQGGSAPQSLLPLRLALRARLQPQRAFSPRFSPRAPAFSAAARRPPLRAAQGKHYAPRYAPRPPTLFCSAKSARFTRAAMLLHFPHFQRFCEGRKSYPRKVLRGKKSRAPARGRFHPKCKQPSFRASRSRRAPCRRVSWRSASPSCHPRAPFRSPFWCASERGCCAVRLCYCVGGALARAAINF